MYINFIYLCDLKFVINFIIINIVHMANVVYLSINTKLVMIFKSILTKKS